MMRDFLTMLVLGAAFAASAQPIAGQRTLQLSAGTQALSDGYGRWHDLTLRGTYALDRHVWQGEASRHRRFGENGSFLGLGDTYTFSEDWFGALSAGVGDGAFYLPRYRLDATLSRKWLSDRRLVTSAGLAYYKAPDGHTDRGVLLGAVYYFEAPVIVEGGIRFNDSDPGSVRTNQRFVALTYGRDKQDLVTARYAWGGEGYLATGPATQLVNFRSREASISWRHWLDSRTGVLVAANRYTNPLYHRSGVTLGIFHDF